MSSVTFYKYCGNGFGEERPLEVGQRQAIVNVSRIVTDIIQIFNHLYTNILFKVVHITTGFA